MSAGRTVECALLKELARTHGWAESISVETLARAANVRDEQRAREVARTQLPSRAFVVYHSGKDSVRLTGPPMDELARALDECGWTPLQIRATLGDYQDTY